uniref:Reverse transcriptase/retrotransposon-derived protein RNase H-like domain-containing protein n=1 Tax=Moniliophthora roreri TaxID=221103 RepID=A0A0W0G0M3_MONRR
MFFRLSNSPATFQAFINDILSDFIDEGWKHDLYFKPEKCEFDISEVIFLGMVIQLDYIAMDPVKLVGIAEWEPPKTIKGVRAFLGFGNFYRKFIGKYTQLARPLHNLTWKSQKFKWTMTCQIAFDLLKQKFLSEPILLMLDTDKPFIIEADASKWVTGAVLHQQGSDGEWHPCGYLSKSFSPMEQNYEIYDCELLAITRALTEW